MATVSPSGRPEARTVVLRGADPAEATVEVHTDSETAKVKALRDIPYAAFNIWIPDAQLQIRLSAKVEILKGAIIEQQWAAVPAASRVSYGTTPAPGVPIDAVYAYEKQANRDRFTVLKCIVQEIDLVHLGPRHRRAAYTREDNWKGTWLAP